MNSSTTILVPVRPPLGLYLRAGRNDHRVLLQVLAEDGLASPRIVFDAPLVQRQRDLIEEVLRRNGEAVLDHRLMELATPAGARRVSLASLPWGAYRHTPAHLRGQDGARVVRALVDFVLTNEFSAVMAPAHFIRGADDDWLPVDAALTYSLRERLDAHGAKGTLIYYPLCLTLAVLRNARQRQRLVELLDGLPIDSLWLRVHPFGTSSSGPIALRRYIEACQDLHPLHVPIIAERSGTLGLALLAFGAVGGIESGITNGETFNIGGLLREPKAGAKPFLAPPRVYLSDLGVFVSRQEAETLFANRRIRAQHGCRDQACCRRGVTDTVADPARHFILSRAKEVARLSQVPPSLRRKTYMDEMLRPATDMILATARAVPRLEGQRRRLDSLRGTLGEIEKEHAFPSVARVPRRVRLGVLKRAAPE